MRVVAVATAGLLAAMMAQAAENAEVTKRHVTVCVDGGAGYGVKRHAQAIASKMFARIGVTIDWQEGLHNCPPQGILVSLTVGTPRGFLPGALGYALPYEGSHIRLFYDRITLGRYSLLVPALLAHVMVHEITHILQGIDEHAAQGVMKAHWTPADLARMIRQPLAFTDDGIDLIYRGLAARTERLQSDATPITATHE